MTATRILVIEDNLNNLELMSYLLSHFGYVPLAAHDGEEGLIIAKRELPDLILCDIQMPKLDGYAVVQRLKNDPILCHIPRIAVTALAMVGDRDKIMASGFIGYIPKPIEPEKFVNQVEVFLPVELVGGHQFIPVSPIPSSPNSTIGNHGIILIVDDTVDNLNLSCSLLEHAGYQVVVTTTVDAAMTLLQKLRPDLILSDFHLPEKNGLDFLRAVKANPDLMTIPFIFISSSLDKIWDQKICLQYGANNFIFRPIHPTAFLEIIESSLMERK